MIPKRLLRHVDRESITIDPVGEQFRAIITVDDRCLFTGKLWAEFSDAASEGYEEYLKILDDRWCDAVAAREPELRDFLTGPLVETFGKGKA